MPIEIKRTRDKVIIKPDDLQKLIKDYVEKETGREVDTDVVFKNTSEFGAECDTMAFVYLKLKD